jgi:hypothetical protein
MQVTFRDLDLGPVRIVTTRMEGEVVDKVFEQSMRDYRSMLLDCQSKRVRIISFVDLSSAGLLTAKQRKLQSEWNREVEPLVREVLLGVGFIAPGALKRGMMTAIFWVSPPAAPYLICASMPEALTWAFGLCADQGIQLSDDMRMDCRRRLT